VGPPEKGEKIRVKSEGYYKILLDTTICGRYAVFAWYYGILRVDMILERGAFQRLACLTYWDKLFG
jgi:hypothetical protein